MLALVLFALLTPTVHSQDLTTPIERYEENVGSMSPDALQAEASGLKTALEAGAKEIDALEAKVAKAAEGEKEAIQKELDAKKAAQDDQIARLRIVVRAMKEKDLEVSDYQVLLMNMTGEVSTDTLSAGAAVGLAKVWLDRAKDWAIEQGPSIILKIVAFLIVLLVFKILAGFLSRVTEKALSLSRVKAPELLKNFFVNVISKTTFLVGLLIALSVIGVPLGPILAGIGVLGFVVGFALQDTLSNFAAGIMVLLYRPYDVGDVVTAAGVTGKVSSMSLVSTTLTTFDNQVEIVPNGKIWGDRITNITANPTRRVDLVFGISYGDDVENAEKILRELVTSHPLVLKDPEPVVKLHALGDSSVNFIVRPWAKTTDYWTVFWDLTKSVKQRFDKEGISIPFPQRDIHIVSGGEALLASKGK